MYSATMPLKPVAKSAILSTVDFLLLEEFNTTIIYLPKPPDLDLVDEELLYLEVLLLVFSVV